MGYSRSKSISRVSRKLVNEAKENKHDKQGFVKKGGKLMVTFPKHLHTWMHTHDLNTEKLSSRSGVSKNRIEGMKNGSVIPTKEEIQRLARVFQVTSTTFLRGSNYNLEDLPDEKVVEVSLDIKDNLKKDRFKLSEEEKKKISDDLRYDEWDDEYKRAIMSIIYKGILKKMDVSAKVCSDKLELSNSMVSNYIAKRYSPSIETLYQTAVCLEEQQYMARDKFFFVVKKNLIEYIPNHNLAVAYNKYKFTQSDFTKKADVPKYVAGEWIRFSFPVSRKYLKQLSNILEVDEELFRDTLMNEEDFKSDTLKAFGGSVEKETEKEVLNEESVKETVKEPVVPETDEDAETVKSVFVNLESEIPMETKVMKMYGKLSKEHRDTVNALIEKYFWEDM